MRAPEDGIVGDRQAQLGEYVQPGTQLMTVVPLDTIYVVANFKETQTARMLQGQKARVEIDALPGKTFDGEVETFAPGLGLGILAAPLRDRDRQLHRHRPAHARGASASRQARRRRAPAAGIVG